MHDLLLALHLQFLMPHMPICIKSMSMMCRHTAHNVQWMNEMRLTDSFFALLRKGIKEALLLIKGLDGRK